MRVCCIVILVFLGGLGAGCSKKEARPVVVTDAVINRWVMDRMRVFYYWNSSLPAAPDYNQEPNGFFDGLKNRSDRFSRIYYKKDPQGVSGTLMNNFGFDVTGVETPAGFLAAVALVVPGSDAEARGLARGQHITAINGEGLNAGNISSVVEGALTGGSIRLQMKTGEVVTVAGAHVAEPVVYRSALLTDGGHKAGYLLLGPFDFSGAYDLIDACAYFKSQQVGDLIVDLRYSPGGSVPLSALLTALLAPVTGDQLYTIFKGNEHAGVISSSFRNELAKQPAGYSFDMQGLLPYQLKLPVVYILTSGQTASAAELVINNLKPYVKVVQVGATTLGKDMASLAITDERQPPVVTDVTLFPMVFKLYNAMGKGDYAQGLVPDHTVIETDALPLKPIGSLDDPLVGKAMGLITGRVVNSQGGAGLRAGGVNKVIYESRRSVAASWDMIYTP